MYLNKLFILYRFLYSILGNYFSKREVYYIIESADWVIRDIGNSLSSNLKNTFVNTLTPIGIRNSIVHYASINTFINNTKLNLAHKSNKIIVTWFHVVENDKRISMIPQAIKYVDIWHTSCNITKQKMILMGIPKNKIVIIPIGVDIDCFSEPSIDDRSNLRDTLLIPKNKIIIGSFQKDGNGWKEGLEPKLIKGPDIFCDLLEKLSSRYDIFVLLTGPARGYVKNRLKEANIFYRHDFLENPNEVANYFKAIDLYVITSREEGGPKSILESMSSGVPLVSTKVGMALDIIIDGENGFLVDVQDVEILYDRVCKIIDNKQLKEKLAKNGLETIKSYDWRNISNQYYVKLYKELS